MAMSMVRMPLVSLVLFGGFLADALRSTHQSPAFNTDDVVRDPQLPGVSNVLKKATNTLQDLADQATAMQESVLLKDKESRERLAEQRKKYESNLTDQAEALRLIEVKNEHIRKEIVVLEANNSQLRKEAEKIMRDNKVMHVAFDVMEPKMRMAERFLTESLRVSNGTSDEALKVLSPPEPEPTLEYFLEVARKEINVGGDHLSLLGVTMSEPWDTAKWTEEPRHTPEDLLTGLAKRLEELDNAEKVGERQLRANFIALWEVGEEKQTKAFAEQTELNSTRKSLFKLQEDLHVAKKHLWENKKDMTKRLEGMQTFTHTVDSIVAEALRGADAVMSPGSSVLKKHNVSSGASQDSKDLSLLGEESEDMKQADVLENSAV